VASGILVAHADQLLPRPFESVEADTHPRSALAVVPQSIPGGLDIAHARGVRFAHFGIMPKIIDDGGDKALLAVGFHNLE